MKFDPKPFQVKDGAIMQALDIADDYFTYLEGGKIYTTQRITPEETINSIAVEFTSWEPWKNDPDIQYVGNGRIKYKEYYK